ncbi:Protein N-terminal and lysine N-methyltransferase efm7 [Podospora pseudoanserina]|uniref:Protein N-terminal and lysine N-methyltransferase EFM7 n=1 Tax=Podospora pseudoanserina TaxID=2609844 RepID=A0ABR0I9D7_9PEZI|nr:Protein N-terminal and lysine N-methyltransferase efm7 [Podospora pseudoanserina]
MSTHDSDNESGGGGELGLFSEPTDYYPPSPPPTTETYTTATGEIITLHLVGHSPLEAHHLWNGSRVISQLFESTPTTTVKNRTVCELGAGAGLPSLVASMLGASLVVCTDFPDPDLIATIQKNIDGCHLLPHDNDKLNIVADGFVWGASPSTLLRHSPNGFDVLILADLLFRHSEHGNMIKTIRETLKRTREAKAYVVFCSYRPWLREKDLKFFDLCREDGFEVEQILEKKMDKKLFEEDPGDEEILKTVTGWVVSWPEKEWVA